MACAQPLTKYKLYEYDSLGVAHDTKKNIVLELDKFKSGFNRFSSEGVVMAFFKQLYDTFTSSSGFTAYFEGTHQVHDLISIKWRTPHWKLVRLK